MTHLSIYRVTMRSGEVRYVVASTERAARRLASEYATEEGLELLDKGDEVWGRELMSDAVQSVRLYRA